MKVFLSLLPLVFAIALAWLALSYYKTLIRAENTPNTHLEDNSSAKNLKPSTKTKVALNIIIISALSFGVTYCNAVSGGERDRRPSYIQLIDNTVDETISKQIEKVDAIISRLGSNDLSGNQIIEELSSLTTELHVLEVLIREVAKNRKELQDELNAKEAYLKQKTEEVTLLVSMSEGQMNTLKRILLMETQRWSYLSLFLGILISIPLFWISEYIRVTWLVPFFKK